MSHPFLLPADPSPISSVRSFGRHKGYSHETTSSQKRPATITTTALAQPATAELSFSDRIQSSLAKEDRIVFDLARLPRLPETDGSRNREILSQNVTTLMDYPMSRSPNLHCSTPSLERPLPSPLTKSTRALSAGSTAYPLLQSPNHISSLDKLKRVHTGAASVSRSPTWRPLYQRTRSQGDIRVSVGWDREEDSIQNSSEASEPLSDKRQEPIAKDRRNRSLSRTSKGRVEKRIEATLAEAEPAANARSRKSSHILGLFKENTASKEIRRGQDKSKSSPEIYRDDLQVDRSGSDRNHTSLKGFDGYHSPNLEHNAKRALIGSSAFGCTQNPDAAGGIVAVCPMGEKNRKLSTGAATSRSLSNISGHLQNGSSNAVFKLTLLQADSPPEHGDITHSNTPPRPIEDQHTLVTLARGNSGPRQNITTKSVDTYKENSAPLCKECKVLAHPLNDSNASDLAERAIVEPLEEYDEESEQISSALYFPHQSPSPDALDDVNIENTGQCEDSPGDTEQPESAALSTQSRESENGSENVDITLQSRNSSRYLHGDLHNSWIPPKEPAFARSAEIGISSASESEYESLDDSARSAAGEYSSLTDEAETTPNATPIPNPLPKARARKSRRAPTAPIGAVELKPYSHQVGGHTTVFRFSKRAICKQLSNRENEFYEVVERVHPELLKFLPR